MLINVTGSITFSTLSQDPFKLVILVEAHTRKIRHRLALSDLKKKQKKKPLNLKILASVTHAGSFITSWRDTRQSWTDSMKSKAKKTPVRLELVHKGQSLSLELVITAG